MKHQPNIYMYWYTNLILMHRLSSLEEKKTYIKTFIKKLQINNRWFRKNGRYPCARRPGHSATGRRPRNMARVIQILFLLHYILLVQSEVLTPRYFNLASKKKITATATCGDVKQELYCKLVGANVDQDEHVIQGQVPKCLCFGNALGGSSSALIIIKLSISFAATTFRYTQFILTW